jgi:FKBP12-rapamycin complex-associated protein
LPDVGDISRPLVKPLLTLLLDKARDPEPSVACSLVIALGELAKVAGVDIASSSDELLDLLLETLADQSSAAKRLAALRTLSHLASQTGLVIKPYGDQPALLPMLVNMLLTETSRDIRRETMRCLGFIGALDPYSQTVCWLPLLSSSHTESIRP